MAIAPGPGPTKIQTPNGPFGFWVLDFGFWILDFGFRILDFGFRILDFGFWILDQFSLRSFCGGPKRPRLDFGFRILDFGLGLGSIDTVWILHKIFASHADSGRRIHYLYTCIDSFIRIHPHAHLDQEHSLTTHEFRARAFCIVSLNFLRLLFFCRCFLSLTTFHALHGQK